MRKTLSASIWALALFCSVKAGDIPNPPVAPPPPMGGTMVEIALTLTQNLLALF